MSKLIASKAAKHLKSCVLELGGKAPAISNVAWHHPLRSGSQRCQPRTRRIVSGAITHSGQACPPERVIIQRGVSEELIERIITLASKIKPSNPTEQDCKLSCVFTWAHEQNLVGMVKSAMHDGAELLIGSLKPEGTWVKPYVVLGAMLGSMLWDRESFGPGKHIMCYLRDHRSRRATPLWVVAMLYTINK